jgi:hypothetical protein
LATVTRPVACNPSALSKHTFGNGCMDSGEAQRRQQETIVWPPGQVIVNDYGAR